MPCPTAPSPPYGPIPAARSSASCRTATPMVALIAATLLQPSADSTRPKACLPRSKPGQGASWRLLVILIRTTEAAAAQRAPGTATGGPDTATLGRDTVTWEPHTVRRGPNTANSEQGTARRGPSTVTKERSMGALAPDTATLEPVTVPGRTGRTRRRRVQA